MVPRHAVHPARARLRLIAAEEHPAVLGLAVHEIVRIAEAGNVLGKLVTATALSATCWCSIGVTGSSRRPSPRPVAPTCRRRRRRARCRSAPLGHDASDLAAARESNRDPLPVRIRDAQRPSGLGDRVGRPVRIEMAVAGQVDGAVEVPARSPVRPAGLAGRWRRPGRSRARLAAARARGADPGSTRGGGSRRLEDAEPS